MEDDELKIRQPIQERDADIWANEELAERRWLYRNFGIDK
jgi:hypothetical protein